MSILTSLFGSRNSRLLKQYGKTVAKINSLEPALEKLSDAELQAKTPEFKERIAKGESLDSILPEAFAVCREASKRVLKMRPFDVQLIGGMALHAGKIAEMGTGEGKTLVATLPAYLNGLTGKGVHVVTVNDYLAQRDAEWMSRLYGWLGLTTGINLSNSDHDEKQLAYAADITYGTNNEFGFDYLRDNMVYDTEDRVQRGLVYSIVDEVDSILIDEARTPLIISGQSENNTDLYYKLNSVPKLLTLQIGEETRDGKGKIEVPGDFTKDEKANQVYLTDAGYEKAEKILTSMGLLAEGASLYDASNIILVHHLYAALRANTLFHRDQHYVVQDGQVIIVDEFTGRLMEGRRWSDGLHQAVEAKEGVKIQNENQTLASITFQNYFRMYHKLAGMTGTAETEASELWNIYKLDVIVIPTNRPVIRDDKDDVIYKTKREKYAAVIEEIAKLVEAGRPVLVGTTSVEISELLSRMLKLRGIKHNVLNAKQHQLEAQVVAEAGRKGQVTIATNMAGRGTDIKLTDEVKAAGGLAIIGTERHESRRVDRQLRGRAGRQGDPGSSLFFVSLEDNLMRLFGSERIAGLMDRMGLKEGEVIQAGMMSRAIERAQRKVEENNFGIRKHLLEYDDVMNAQREVIYTRRRHAVYGERIEVDLNNIMVDFAESFVETYGDGEYEDFKFEMIRQVAVQPSFNENEFEEAKKKREVLAGMVVKDFQDAYARRMASIAATTYPVIKNVYEKNAAQYENIYVPVSDGRRVFNVPVDLKKAYDSEGKEVFKHFSKVIMLVIIDEDWKEHLREMDDLRQSVRNASYEQKDPLLIYKFESYNLFSKMLEKGNREILSTLFKAFVPVKENPDVTKQQMPQPKTDLSQLQTSRNEAAAAAGSREKSKPAPVHVEKKVGRNDPCPCGSGKKYKHCHGKMEA